MSATSIRSALAALLPLFFLVKTVFCLTMNTWENSLKDIIVKNKRVVESKYITFTTLGEDSWPSARTVVFRGFHVQDDRTYLKFISDSRSQKITDLERCNKVELCWYLTKDKDQFRIKGYGTSVGITSEDSRAAKLRVQLWNGLSDGARAPFFFPGNPGDLVGDKEKITSKVTGVDTDVSGVVTSPTPDSKSVTEALVETKLEPSMAKSSKKFIPVIPDPETVRALRAERKTGEEEPSKDKTPPPDCFNLILVEPISGKLSKFITEFSFDPVIDTAQSL